MVDTRLCKLRETLAARFYGFMYYSLNMHRSMIPLDAARGEHDIFTKRAICPEFRAAAA